MKKNSIPPETGTIWGYLDSRCVLLLIVLQDSLSADSYALAVPNWSVVKSEITIFVCKCNKQWGSSAVCSMFICKYHQEAKKREDFQKL